MEAEMGLKCGRNIPVGQNILDGGCTRIKVVLQSRVGELKGWFIVRTFFFSQLSTIQTKNQSPHALTNRQYNCKITGLRKTAITTVQGRKFSQGIKIPPQFRSTVELLHNHATHEYWCTYFSCVTVHFSTATTTNSFISFGVYGIFVKYPCGSKTTTFTLKYRKLIQTPLTPSAAIVRTLDNIRSIVASDKNCTA